MTADEVKALQNHLVAPPNSARIFSHVVRTTTGFALKVEVYPIQQDAEIMVISFLLNRDWTADEINRRLSEQWSAGADYAELLAKQIEGMRMGMDLDAAYPLIWRYIERLKDDIAYLRAENHDLQGLLDEAAE